MAPDDAPVPIPSPATLPLSTHASNRNGDHRRLVKYSTAPVPRSSTRVHLLAKFATQVELEPDTNTLARSRSNRSGLSRLTTFLAIGQDIDEDSSDEESDKEDKLVDFSLTRIKLLDNNGSAPKLIDYEIPLLPPGVKKYDIRFQRKTKWVLSFNTYKR
ncbi:hypothetical protein M427DRAFT_70765, partial [Gonapodya prolifera JEL478]